MNPADDPASTAPAAPAGEPAPAGAGARDTAERIRIEEALRRGERLFEGIAEANRLLLTAPKVSDAFAGVLHALGEATDSDRVHIFELRRDRRADHDARALRAEWARDWGLSVHGDPRSNSAPASDAASGIARRLADGAPVEARIEALPEPERSSYAARGVMALLAFPIAVSNRVWGYIAFEQCRHGREWTPGERSALGTAAGNIGQALGRERMLAALAESEQRYEALLASLSEAVFQVDLEARWRFLNPAWEEMTGYSIEQCLGQRFSDYLGPDDAAAALEGFGRLVSGHDQRVENELRFRHRSGRESWLRVAARPQFDEAGRVAGVTGTLVDVTQRRQAQAALGASERRFTAVFAGSSDALLLVDSATEAITECNPRALEMFEAEAAGDLAGLRVEALLREAPGEAEMREGRERLAHGEAWTREAECVTRRGRAFWGQVALARMATGAVGTTLLRVTDITTLKRSEERLRASLVEKEVLLKEVYHRVKNNLQIISALLRMQSRRVSDKHAVEALENSISRVMAMSMVHEKLYQAQNLVSIDFLSFAQSLVGFLNQLAIGAKAGGAVEVSGTSLALSIDQAIPLGLVLNELVTNSLKYAFPEGRSGRVSVRIMADGPGAARIVVADDGSGLPEGTDLEKAAGLGFRIVRMLVDQLHGSFQIESRGGLRVTVRFPLPDGRDARIAPG
jgi:PAS domain S-box-containing protein